MKFLSNVIENTLFIRKKKKKTSMAYKKKTVFLKNKIKKSLFLLSLSTRHILSAQRHAPGLWLRLDLPMKVVDMFGTRLVA